ncbi:MAG: hypothetical protein JNK72_21300 [Myxococcales bacterium]|nr:hypothetical protein [Myxococcales bacterium]
MATRRHLPVLQSTPRAAPPEPAAAEAEAPPWHWIPLGTTLSVVVFALLAQGAGRLSVRVFEGVYGVNPSAAQIAAVRAARPLAAHRAELVGGLIPVGALLLSVGLGAWVVGRFGPSAHARHGMLSGALTALVFWAVAGRLWGVLWVVPLAMVSGWAATRLGLLRRHPRDAGRTMG